MRKKFKLNSRMYDINGNPIMYRTECLQRTDFDVKTKARLSVKSKTVPLEGIVGNLKNAENQP